MKSGGMAQGNARSRILRAIEYLEAHYNEDIAINELAERYGMSPNYFSSLFKKEKQQSTVNYLIELRIRKAGDVYKRQVVDNLLAVFAEDIDVVITDEVVDFNVCTVSCAKCHRTV